jgi:hypothetical protein
VENLKKSRPSAVCMRCGDVWYADEQPAAGALHQCDPAKAEKGAISLRPTADRWMDCWNCGGTGINAGAACPACKGVGYHPTQR